MTEQTRAIVQPGILEFARAFRSAARAVGFYPPDHPAVAVMLEAVQRSVRPLTDQGSLCLTILPDRLLAGGLAIEGADRLVAEVAAILHRHGIGAMLLNGKTTPDSWRALFALLAQPPEEVRAAGGAQRQWTALRQPGPGILEIDFKELLLGRVGGDVAELSAVIGHYLESAGVHESLGSDVVAHLTRALDRARDDTQAVDAVLKELRSAAHMVRVLQPAQFEDVFRNAATVAARLTEGTLAGLLAARGTEAAMLGPVDVAAAFVDRISDQSAAEFLASALTKAGHASPTLTGVLSELLPDAARRRAVTRAAHQSLTGTAVERGFLEQWAEIEQQLESYSDRQFVPDAYARELHGSRQRAASAVRAFDDAPERLAAWADSVDDAAIRQLDLSLLTDLSRLETDAFRWRDVLAILRAHIIGAAERSDWEGASVAAEAIARVAADPSDTLRSPPALEVLQALARNWVGEEALARLTEGEAAHAEPCRRLLRSLGPACVPSLVRRWSGELDNPVRERIEAVVVGLGQAGREAMVRLLSTGDPDVRCATIRLLGRAGGHEHFAEMQALLADPSPRVRREALTALASASAASESARELAARGIGEADPERMHSLLETLIALGPERAVPVLLHVVRVLDLRDVPAPIWFAVIEGLQRGRSAQAAHGLSLVFETPLWRSPMKALRIRAAAKRALVAMGEPAADALRGVSMVGGLRS